MNPLLSLYEKEGEWLELFLLPAGVPGVYVDGNNDLIHYQSPESALRDQLYNGLFLFITGELHQLLRVQCGKYYAR